MAKKNNSARKHSSPRLYFTDTVVNYATKSLGITSLGVVGETLRGRAFEPTTINDWGEYIYNFGGTSTEKFRGSQYPKYELPYIAQSYLEQSHNLNVVRVLGLSGVNAGPAWVVSAKGDEEYNNMVLLVLRSRGEHKKAAFVKAAEPDKGICDDQYEYDGIYYYAKEVTLEPSKTLNLGQNCNPGFIASETGNGDGYFTSDALNYGTFTIKVLLNDGSDTPNYKYYSVTLNPSDKNYIYNVIGGEPDKGDAEIYVEELYDVALRQLVNEGKITGINQTVTTFENVNIVPQYEDVYDLLTDPLPTRKMLGKRYLYSPKESVITDEDTGVPTPIQVRYSTDNGKHWIEADGVCGMIYTVMSRIDPETGKRSLFYGAYVEGVALKYNKVTKENKIQYLDSTLSCVTKCMADTNPSLVQNSFGVVDTTTVHFDSTYPKYEMSGKSKPKILSKKDSDEYWGLIQDVDGRVDMPSKSLCDYNEVTRLNSGDCIVMEFGDKTDKIPANQAIKFVVKYGDKELTPNSDNQHDGNTFIVENANGIWIIFVHCGGQDNDFVDEQGDDTAGFGTDYIDPSQLKVEFKDVKYYEAQLTQATNPDTQEVYNDGIIVSNTPNFKTELLSSTYCGYKEGTAIKFTECVRVVTEDSFYVKVEADDKCDVYPITLDFNNYKEQYRWAVSPWIVSEMKGSAEKVELNRLFRFHAISDGNNSTTEFKVSIENINPNTGKFDVVVRDYYDSDLSVNAYEKYLSCNMVPGSPNYIGLKIGTTDGMYNSKSRYITVEVIESDATKNSIPAGFLGYPIRNYGGLTVSECGKVFTYYHWDGSDWIKDETPHEGTVYDSDKTFISLPEHGTGEGKTNEEYIRVITVHQLIAPYFRYNTNIDDEIKAKKQYFGVSDLVGIDDDVFKYKGVEAYDGKPEGLTPCFHLDSRIINGKPNGDGAIYDPASGVLQTVSVDNVTGYTWVTVNKNNTTSYGIEPRIGDEAIMVGTIYEDKAYRKFTVAMYGGWDGWDYYRTVRSNGDEFRYKEYKGAIDKTSGYGSMFSVYKNPESIGFNTGDKVINSDYYAYLAGVKLLGNPKSITVNVLATPGIDYVNNKALVDDVVDIVEDDRGDLIYVITTPDKPSGAGDSVEEMYSAEDAVYNLEDSDIDSNHCCTYYPWVKYYDEDNYQYIYLPLTRDVVRSIAYTDNVKFSWYANAGWNRGNIPDNASPKKKLTLGEQDTLYDGRINFVNSFAEEGNKIWGDKNLQIDDNLLNRISKRRLLLRIRTMLQNACIGLIFDPNDLTMSQTVRSAVTKVLDDVKMGRGITDYKIEIDDSPETRDQLGLNVTYHIKPIQALEWINFTSVLTPEGMDWQ